MRLIWQGIGLGLAALVLLAFACANFAREWDFGSRAVVVQAEVTGRDIGSTSRRTAYSVMLGFDLQGQRYQVAARVKRSAYLTLQDGDAATIRVDPDNPRVFVWHGTLYAGWALAQAMAGLAVMALAVLSILTGVSERRTGRKGWRGAAFPWLAE
jgi:hypothetical protein